MKIRPWQTVEYRRVNGTVVGAIFAALLVTVAAPASAAGLMTFTTLGTNSGPIPSPERSEPANLVRYDGQSILVDVGDGAVEQLAKAGLQIGDVQTLLISHLHFDHTGGLFAFLSLRYQGGYTTPLRIYGPPGTKTTVERLLAAMEPGVSAVGTMRAKGGGVGAGIEVTEIKSGDHLVVGPIAITTVENTHYATLRPDTDGERPLSLSYRFETGGRSILYTGDTGPSQAVETLCHGADLVVSEIMDPEAALAKLKKSRPDAPPMALQIVADHFHKEHLSPAEAGLLAQRCGAKALVLTHDALSDAEIPAAKRVIANHFTGPITFAKDLQRFSDQPGS